MPEWQSLIDDWFGARCKPFWFASTPEFDAELDRRYRPLFERAEAGLLGHWEDEALGALALVLLLDQFPRNVYRGTPRAFATDSQAYSVADRAIAAGHDRAMPADDWRVFFYLPFEHSERIEDQYRCAFLMARLDSDPEWLRYSLRHFEIIARFGRFPHRNAILRRASTPAEIAFLAEPNSSF